MTGPETIDPLATGAAAPGAPVETTPLVPESLEDTKRRLITSLEEEITKNAQELTALAASMDPDAAELTREFEEQTALFRQIIAVFEADLDLIAAAAPIDATPTVMAPPVDADATLSSINFQTVDMAAPPDPVDAERKQQQREAYEAIRESQGEPWHWQLRRGIERLGNATPLAMLRPSTWIDKDFVEQQGMYAAVTKAFRDSEHLGFGSELKLRKALAEMIGAGEGLRGVEDVFVGLDLAALAVYLYGAPQVLADGYVGPIVFRTPDQTQKIKADIITDTDDIKNVIAGARELQAIIASNSDVKQYFDNQQTFFNLAFLGTEDSEATSGTPAATVVATPIAAAAPEATAAAPVVAAPTVATAPRTPPGVRLPGAPATPGATGGTPAESVANPAIDLSSLPLPGTAPTPPSSP